MSTPHKVGCLERRCEWRGNSEQLLRAPNPFDDTDELVACPSCRSMEVYRACDEPDCWQAATCGTPTAHGPRRTCGRHIPLAEAEAL